MPFLGSKLLTSGKMSRLTWLAAIGAGDLVLAIDLMDRAAVDDSVGTVVGGVGVQFAVGRDDVQPLGKEQVDLR